MSGQHRKTPVWRKLQDIVRTTAREKFPNEPGTAIAVARHVLEAVPPTLNRLGPARQFSEIVKAFESFASWHWGYRDHDGAPKDGPAWAPGSPEHAAYLAVEKERAFRNETVIVQDGLPVRKTWGQLSQMQPVAPGLRDMLRSVIDGGE